MASKYQVTQSHANYACLCRLYVEFFRDLLWDVLEQNISVAGLNSELQRCLHDIRYKKNHRMFKKLCDAFLRNGALRSTDCDISVLYAIFRNIQFGSKGFSAPSEGWGSIPLPGDKLVADDIERIRIGRNEFIGHPSGAQLSDDDFETQTKAVTDIVSRLEIYLGLNKYRQWLIQIKKECKSPTNCMEQYIKYIKTLESQIEELDTKVEQTTSTIQNHTRVIAQQGTQLDKQDETLTDQGRAITSLDSRLGNIERESKPKETPRDKDTKDKTQLKTKLIDKYMKDTSQIEPLRGLNAVEASMFLVPFRVREDPHGSYAMTCKGRRDEGVNVPNEIEISTASDTTAYDDIFLQDDKQHHAIIVKGMPGVGKTTFCHQLVHKWCSLQNLEAQNRGGHEGILKSFEFLFFVKARHSYKPQTLLDMIKEQNCPLSYYPIVNQIFSSRPDKCLVVVDGLDEWHSSLDERSGLPDATTIQGCTILATTRPWKVLEIDNDLEQSCRILEIQCLTGDSVKSLVRNLVQTSPSANADDEVESFMSMAKSKRLQELIQIPLLSIIMVTLWLNWNRTLKKCMAYIYSGLLAHLLSYSTWKVDEQRLRRCASTLPPCLAEDENCVTYSSLIMTLAEFAFNSLFRDQKKYPLLFSELSLTRLIGDTNLRISLQLGILSKSTFKSESKEKHVAVSFLHSTFQEYLCAVYLSGDGFEVGYRTFCERVSSTIAVFEYEHILVFLSGMNARNCQALLDHMCGVLTYRQYAHRNLLPDDKDYICDLSMRGIQEQLVRRCMLELEASDTNKTPYVQSDMVIENTLQAKKLEARDFSRNRTNIKSLIYKDTAVTSLNVIHEMKEMQNIEKLCLQIKHKRAEDSIQLLGKHVVALQCLRALSIVICGKCLPLKTFPDLIKALSNLPCIDSLHFDGIRYYEETPFELPLKVTSLSLRNMTLSYGLLCSLQVTMTTLSMYWVCIHQTTVEYLCNFFCSSSSLQMLTLSHLPGSPPVFETQLNLSSHTSLRRLTLGYIQLEAGLVLSSSPYLRILHMHCVTMPDGQWMQLLHFLNDLPNIVDVELKAVKTIGPFTHVFVLDNFKKTIDTNEAKGRDLHFHTK